MKLIQNNEFDSDSEQLSNDTELFNAIHRRPKKNQTISEEERLTEIQECITIGANVNAINKNDKGNTVLHVAVKKCYEKIVRFLLGKPNINIDIYNTDDKKAQDIAVELSNQNIIQLFENYNKGFTSTSLVLLNGKDASKSANNTQNKSVHQNYNTDCQIKQCARLIGLQLPLTDITEDQSRKLNQIDKQGNTPLLNAALQNQQRWGCFLIQSGVIDINYQNTKTKQSAIDIVWEYAYYDFMLMLLENGSKFPQSFTLNALNDDTIPEELKNWINERAQLHQWIRNNELKKVKDFVKENEVSKFFNSNNQSPLETAAEYADVEIVKTLIHFLDIINLTEDQHELLLQVNENDETLLSIAAKGAKIDNIDFFIKCGIDINHRNKDSKLAVDFAWENKHYDIVLRLLESDSEFPKCFNLEYLNEEESTQQELKQFVIKRDALHKLIKENNLKSIKDFTNSTKSKFYLNSQNKSAVLTAIENENFNIYAFFRSIEVVFKDDSEKKCIEILPEGKKHTLQETMLNYFPKNEKSHIYYLISKSIPCKTIKDTDKFTQKVQALYEKLDSIPEIAMILKIVQYADSLQIIFDFDNENIQDINPTASTTTRGTADYKEGRLYISSIEEKKLLGTLAHELTHFAMYILYKNDCNPFDNLNNSNMQVFAEITEELKKCTKNDVEKMNQTDGNIEDSPIVILARAFRYKEEEQQSEIIVRIPHILAQYNDEGREWLLKTDQRIKRLFDYYSNNKEGGLTYDCQLFIDNSFFIKPYSTIQTLNELEGEVNNIIKYGINFEKPIDLDEFLKSKKPVFILKAESTLLGIISIYQSLINKNYSTHNSLFLKFNSYIEKYSEINKAFYSIVGKVLCIRYTSDSNQQGLSKVSSTLNQLLKHKVDKKIIFIIKDIKIEEWNKVCLILSDKIYDGKYVSYKCTLNDFTESSQDVLLGRVVEFQGHKIGLNKLIDSRDKNAKQIINSETLVQLIKNEEIKIGHEPLGTSDLEGAYSKFYDDIDKDILIEHLSDKSDNIIVLSGITQKKFSKEINLGFHNKIKTHIDNEKILIREEYSENNFKSLCHTNPEKEIVWINWNSNKFILRQFYNPRFLIPIYLKKTIINIDIKNQFKADIVLQYSRYQFDDLLKLEEDQNKKKEISSSFDQYLSKIKNILIIDEPEKQILTIYTDIQHSKKFEELINFLMIARNTDIENIKYNPEAQFQKCIEDNSTGSTHWLKSEESSGIQHLIWYKSYGSLDILRPYIDQNHTIAFKGNEFFDKIKDNKAAVIIDGAGMGKSTILTTISTKLLESYWVIRIQLKDHTRGIDQLPNCVDINAALEFLENTGSINSPLEKNLAEYTLRKYSSSPKPLLLVCDGFDEIRGYTDKGKKKTCALLKFLKDSTSASILVAAREEEAGILQDSLSIFDIIKITKLSESQQKQLLETYWKNSLKWQSSIDALQNIFLNNAPDAPFTIYAEKLLNMMHKVLIQQGNNFIGTPLMLRLLAEVYQDKFKHFIKSIYDNNHEEDFNDLSISTIYQHVIDAKYKIYFREKIGISTDLIHEEAILKSAFTKKYWRLAFQELFPQQAKDFIGVKTPFSTVKNNALLYDNQELAPLMRVALIRPTQFTNIEFIHFTFAEYFVAELLNNWLSKGHGRHQKYPSIEEFLLTKILLNPTYKTIRLFLNTQLTKQHVTSDAIDFYGQKTTTLWSEVQKKFFNSSYQTALHIATQENNQQIIDLLLKIFSTHQEKLISLLTVRDKYQQTALYVAAKNHNNDLIKKFLASVKHCEKTIQQDLILATIFRKYEDQKDPNIKYLLEYISTNKYSIIGEILNNIEKQWDLIEQFFQMAQDENINAKPFEDYFTRIDDTNIKKYLMLSSDNEGNTVLHLTCRLDFHYLTKWLIERRANVNAVNSNGDSVLHVASVLGNLKTIKLLIKHGANIHAINHSGDSVLHVACSYKGECIKELIKWLVDHGADVNAINHNGYSALDLAVKNDHWVIVQFLITRIDINDHITNTIDLLIDKYQWHLIQLIVAKGVNVNAKNDNQTILLSVAAKSHVEETFFEVYKWKGQNNLIKWLVERVENINDQDKEGNTVLHYVAVKGHLELVKWLIVQHKANVNVTNKNGDTVLHIMTYKGQYKLVQWLLEHDLDINATNLNGYSAVDLAVAYGYWKIAKWLVSHGANIGAQVLHAASHTHWIDFDFLESLIKNKKQCGQDIINDTIDTNGNTLLHKFAQNKHLVLLNFVLRHGAKVEAKNRDGHTALDLIIMSLSKKQPYNKGLSWFNAIIESVLNPYNYTPPKPYLIDAISYPPCKANSNSTEIINVLKKELPADYTSGLQLQDTSTDSALTESRDECSLL